MQATMHIAQANMSGTAESENVFQSGSDLEQVFLDHKDLVFRAAYRVTGNSK